MKLTPAQQRAKARADAYASAEVAEMIDNFERQRGLHDPRARPPRTTVAKLRETHSIERMQEELRSSREGRGGAVPRGTMMSRTETIWQKSPLIRPVTAPARATAAAAAARRNEAVYSFWLKKHRDEILRYERAVESMRADAIRTQKERVDTRRRAMLAQLRTKKALHDREAISRQEPFWIRRQLEAQRATQRDLLTARAWSQEIVFLPPKVAAADAEMQRDRSAPDFNESIRSVQGLR